MGISSRQTLNRWLRLWMGLSCIFLMSCNSPEAIRYPSTEPVEEAPTPEEPETPIEVAPASSTFIYRVGPNDDTLRFGSLDLTTGELVEHIGLALPVGSEPVGLAFFPGRDFIYVGHRGTDKIVQYSLNDVTGRPTFASEIATVGGDILKLYMDPLGRFLFSLQDDQVVTYTIHSTTGALTSQGSLAISGGLSLEIDPSGQHMYVSGAGSLTNSYAIDPTSGVLISPGVAFAAGLNAMKLNPAGTRLYGPGYQNSTALIFDRAAVTGELSLYSFESTPFTFPYRDMVMNAAGTHLYMVNNDRGVMDSFSIDAGTGFITFVNAVGLPLGCSPESLAFAHSGAFLFTPCTDSSGKTMGVSVNGDGSLNGATVTTSTVAGSAASSILVITF